VITPKENLIRAITFNNPHHVPHSGENLLQRVDFAGNLPPAHGLDLWGVRWESTHEDLAGYVVGHACRSLEELLALPFPDPRRPGLFEEARQKMDLENCLVIGRHLDLPFTRFWSLLGMENALVQVAAHPAEVAAFMQRLAEWNIAIAEGYVKIGVEAARLSDDYGTQRGLFISPQAWRRLVKPALAQIVAYYKAAGCFVFLHSCGRLVSILDDLVEMGIDVFNIQVTANDLPAYRRKYGRRISFQGGVASQVLSTGTREDARSAAQAAMHELGQDGGLILEPDQPMIVPQENLQALIDAAVRFGKYPLDFRTAEESTQKGAMA